MGEIGSPHKNNQKSGGGNAMKNVTITGGGSGFSQGRSAVVDILNDNSKVLVGEFL
ncbi:hypothetical protein [Endozoicomonas sp. GU-1]|uniref:hypothetical protein n=1 Tax=Endozoicomonas sp. GU-1 TaxID=3009078 RepID=UPI0022B52334|nr:hypothetical protein [Endozoicomonas sp. GU-1]WBA80576.1 hypothetical protein O2T12_19975 [Endozoicomonas sp. GU-1]WBA88143.1 hypothetical protein O3276_09180 [Endozoicomonas sp. GU-1]